MNYADQNKLSAQFKYYTLLAVTYTIFMVTAQAIAYRMIEIGPYLLPGGIFVFPASFAVNDIIAEVYGPTMARKSIFIALYAQMIFSVVPLIVNVLPHPGWWHHAQEFKSVFGLSWLVFVSNFAAVLVGMVLNTQIIAKTKLMMKGRFFALRSLLSSAIGEFILTAIIVIIALMPVEGIVNGFALFIDMFLFKVIFSAIVVYPASIVVVLLNRAEKIDIYEDEVSCNPFKLFKKKETESIDNVIDFRPANLESK